MIDCGIYQFLNIKNNKRYIGSSVDVYKRKFDHLSLLKNDKHHSNYFQNAWNKHGEEFFIWSVLEECDKEDLICREQFYIDKFNPEYNICKIAGSSLGLKRSKETRDKISKSKIGKCAGKDHYNYGKKRAQNVIDKMSFGMKKVWTERNGNFRPNWKGHTQEAKNKLSEANKGNHNRKGKFLFTDIEQLDIETHTIINSFNNAVEAAKAIGRFNKSDSSKIIRACKETYRTAFGFKWKFKHAQEKFGELRETPEVDNPDPSLLNVENVNKKEQRIESEETTNNLSTSAEHV